MVVVGTAPPRVDSCAGAGGKRAEHTRNSRLVSEPGDRQGSAWSRTVELFGRPAKQQDGSRMASSSHCRAIGLVVPGLSECYRRPCIPGGRKCAMAPAHCWITSDQTQSASSITNRWE